MKYIVLIMTLSCFIYAEEIDLEYRYKERKLKFRKMKFQFFNEQRYISLEDFLNILKKTEEVKITKKEDKIIIKRDYEKFIVDLDKGEIKKLEDKNNIIWEKSLEKKAHDRYINIFSISEIFYEYGMNFYYKNGEYKMLNSIDLMKDITDKKIIPNLDNENQVSYNKKKESILYFFKILKNNYDTGKSEDIDRIISFLKEKHFKEIINTRNNEEYYESFKRMIDELNNKHIRLIPDNVWSPTVNRKRFENGGKLLFKGGQIYYKAPLKADLEVKSINNISLYSKSKKHINKVLQDVFLENSHRDITLEVIRKNKTETIHVRKEKNYKGHSYYGEEMIYRKVNKNTAYLYIPSFVKGKFQKDFANIFEDLKKAPRVIIDIRGNSGGEISNVSIFLSSLLTNDIILTNKIKNENFVNKIDGQGLIDSGIILLVNEKTFSAATVFAGVLKYKNRGIIVGEKTGGGTSSPFAYVMPDNTIITIPGMPIFIGNEEKNYSLGVHPDIYLEDQMINGKDLILERGILEIQKKD